MESSYSKVGDVHPGPPVRGENIFLFFEKGIHYLDRYVEKFIPVALNPFVQAGAVANVCFLIATFSGIVLLLWYSPSVHQAYESLENLKHTSHLGEWTRSLHRYSSDLCIFFIIYHAIRVLLARTFTGPRAFAWITGIILFVVVWLIGWLGYWLVWDVRAQHVALGTMKFIDVIPIFAEPLSRSYLTDATVNSLLCRKTFLSPLRERFPDFYHKDDTKAPRPTYSFLVED